MKSLTLVLNNEGLKHTLGYITINSFFLCINLKKLLMSNMGYKM